MLLGVLLIWILTELYGWPRSGLVVPGYLASVFVIQPWAGLVVLGEAILTYILSVLVARWLPRIAPLDRAFGRNRFFLILLVSVGVRLFVEGGPFLRVLEQWGLPLDTPLNSLGLVLVPLTANAMWRTGLFKGLPMLAAPTLAVYLLLLFVLLPHTNLSFAQFELTYEDLSRDFISSPRAYMLLLVGALMATHMAIRYGWDAGGIIIPGLLAITWVHPEKLLATLVEVVLIVGALRLLQRLPVLRTSNITGMRPLVLAFTAGYVVKLLLSFGLAERYPGLRITDLFGFGYLLPALIAVRCWRYGSLPRVVFPGIAISLAAFLVGTSLGVGLEQLRPLPQESIKASIHQRAGPAWRAATEVTLPPSDFPDTTVLVELRDAWRVAWDGSPWSGDHLRADVYPDGVVLHSGGQNQFGSAWLRKHTHRGLVVVVPDAATEPGLAEAGVVLVEVLDARVLLLSPSTSLRRQATAGGAAVLDITTAGTTTFEVARRLPDDVDLNRLSAVIPDLIPEWDLPSNAQADARLALDESTVLELALRRFEAEPMEGRVALYDPNGIPWPETATPPDTDDVPDLLFLKRAVVVPLLRARNGDARWARLAAAQAERLGLRVAVDEDLVTLGPAPDTPPPRFTLWLRRDAPDPTIFEVRAARRHLQAAEVARAWWVGREANAILVHDAGADLDSQALQRAYTTSPEATILRTLVLDAPGTTVVSVDAYREDEFPGADAVVSIGRPLGPGDSVPDYVNPVRELIEGSGGSVVWYDGDYQRIRFYDPSNPRADVVRYAGGLYVTVYLSPLFRERFATPDTSAALRTLLQGTDIGLRRASLHDLLRAPAADTSTAAETYRSIMASLARNAVTGHPGELDRLRRLAHVQGMEVWVFEDEDDGLPYLVIEDHEIRLVAALSRANGTLTDNPADSAQVRTFGKVAVLHREPAP